MNKRNLQIAIAGVALLIIAILLIGTVLISAARSNQQNNFYIKNTINYNYISYHSQKMQNRVNVPWNVPNPQASCQRIQ